MPLVPYNTIKISIMAANSEDSTEWKEVEKNRTNQKYPAIFKNIHIYTHTQYKNTIIYDVTL